MGRKAIPASMHKLKGTFQPVRHARAAKIGSVEIGLPPCPEGLSDEAKEAWSHVGRMLDARGVLTYADSAALEILCEAYADWKRLRAEVSAEGETYETETSSGDQMRRPNPKVALRDNAEKRLRASLTDFGLSPSARSRIESAGVSIGENKFARLARENSEKA